MGLKSVSSVESSRVTDIVTQYPGSSRGAIANLLGDVLPSRVGDILRYLSETNVIVFDRESAGWFPKNRDKTTPSRSQRPAERSKPAVDYVTVEVPKGYEFLTFDALPGLVSAIGMLLNKGPNHRVIDDRLHSRQFGATITVRELVLDEIRRVGIRVEVPVKSN